MVICAAFEHTTGSEKDVQIYGFPKDIERKGGKSSLCRAICEMYGNKLLSYSAGRL